MGKIKRQRQKFHLSGTKSKGNSLEQSVTSDGSLSLLQPPTENVFSGLNISVHDLKQNLPELDTISIVSSKIGKQGKQLKKKEKQQMRHELFLKKLNVVQQMRKKAKQKKKIPKAVPNPVSDMKHLLDALPPINIHLKEKHRRAESKVKKRSVPKMKQRQKTLLQNISIFQKVLSNPDYKANPAEAVTRYIQEKMLQEA